MIFMQALDSGLANSVCTLYEIHSGADTTSEGMLYWTEY